MASMTYQDLLQKAYDRGTVKDSQDWFGNKINAMYYPRHQRQDNIDPEKNRPEILQKAESRMYKGISYGAMQLFHYDPKHKDTLPIYDTFPLCIPFKPEPGGFLGLNFHYLSPNLRARLLDRLMYFVTDKTLNENSRFALTYQLLDQAVKTELFKPCLKRYLHSHVRSRFIYITPAEWSKALFLPLENFITKKK